MTKLNLRKAPWPILIALALLLSGQPWAQAKPANWQAHGGTDWRGALPADHPASLGHRLEVRNTRLTLRDQLTLQVDTLHGQAVSVGSDPTINLDNPSQYRVNIEHAQVFINDAAIVQAVSQELQQSGAPIRIEQVTTRPEGIRVSGKIKRLGLWLSFFMEGSPRIASATDIELQPTRMEVAGVPFFKALLATNIQLESLVNMKSKSVFLKGQAMVLKPQQLLDQPALDFDLQALTLQNGGVKAVLGRRSSAPDPFCKRTQCPESFVYTAGGPLRAAGLELPGLPTLAASEHNAPLAVALHNLQNTLRNSAVLLRPDGAVWINTGAKASAQQHLGALAEGQSEFALLADQQGIFKEPQAKLAMLVHHADLQTPSGIGLRVEKMLSLSQADSLVDLPGSTQQVLAGHIELEEAGLDTLMNQHLFAYEGSPIKQVETHVKRDALDLHLLVRPQLFGLPTLWLPTRLEGTLNVATNRRGMIFTPSTIRVLGISVGGILEWAGISLDQLIHIERPSVKLSGNTLLIDLSNALPPMHLDTELHEVRLVEQGNHDHHVQLHVGLRDQTNIGKIYNAIEQMPSGLWLYTKGLTALGIRTGPTLAHVHTPQHATRLAVDLGRFPGLLGDGVLRLPADQQLLIEMPPSEHPIQSHRHEQHTH
ncbi:hypothetical protein [Limnobacter sp.]|uniref:hypothetical protein n=1 Tax=Limnobacter sp. TaxID=2003368 RepID=UPI003519B22A